MPAESDGLAQADRIERLLQVFGEGSTSPALAQTAEGERYVVKFSGAGPGPRALLTEFLAMRLAERLGVRVPPVRKLFVPRSFPWQIGTDEFDSLVQRSAGWNLGVRFIPDARDIRAGELGALPDAFLAPLALADRLLQNVDRTRENPNLLRDGLGGLWAIDYGACLFVERIILGSRRFPFAMPANHFLAGTRFAGDTAALEAASRDSAVLIGAGLSRASIDACIAELPGSWLAALPIPPAVLAERLAAYADAFAASLGNIVKTCSDVPMPRSG